MLLVGLNYVCCSGKIGRLVRSRLQWAGHVERMADMTDYRGERQRYERRTGGDEVGQDCDGRTVLGEM